MAGVTYQQMTTYIRSETEPLWEHVKDHDQWHRERLEAELVSIKAARRASISQWLALATLVAAVVVPIVTR